MSGGVISKYTLDTAIQVSGSEHPRIVVDTSPKLSPEEHAESVASTLGFFDKFGLNPPTFLNIESTKPGANEALVDNLRTADILMVTGGSTLRAYQRWQQAGVTEVINDRVSRGQLVGFGASAGAMIWFQNGLSDSLQYEHSGDEPWQYVDAPGAGIVPAWVTAHYSDTDEFGRVRSDEFAQFLSKHPNEWNRAVGIDTDAAIISINGLAIVIEASDRPSQPKKVHIFDPLDNTPVILGEGDTFRI